jgi:hypothetical protein
VQAQEEIKDGTNCSGGVCICFGCNSGWVNGDLWHYDVLEIGAGLLGTYHSDSVLGGCSDWINQGHAPYSQMPEQVEARQAVRTGTDFALLQAMTKYPTTRLNTDRSALQVVTTDGRVVFHAALDRSQTDRLSAALSAIQVATRLEASLQSR